MTYGPLAAAQAGLHVYVSTCRRTGRTSAALAALKPGDTLVVSNEKEAHRVRHDVRRINTANAEAWQRGADPATLPPKAIQVLSLQALKDREWRGDPLHTEARYVFDHTAAELVVTDALRTAMADLQRWTGKEAPDPSPRGPGFVPSIAHQWKAD
ncbi:hypothetical protein TMCBR3_gp034c [Caulobacter phage TMCBR3]|nr:hypothetical protein TMCBR3_gp034c [Caulobacter phage TMCBR3]